MNEGPDPEEAEEIADIDLDALNAIAEALLDEVIQARTEQDLRRIVMPAQPEGPGSGELRSGDPGSGG